MHSLGMAVLQKNDPQQTPELESYFDGALSEQCNQYKECEDFAPYIAAGKPVLNAEYHVATRKFCSADETPWLHGRPLRAVAEREEVPALLVARRRTRVAAMLVVLAAIAGAAAGVAGALSAAAASGLPYSHASASTVQPQPPAGSCHARGSGLFELPDPRCTPGALNPAVTQRTIGSTICSSGWTSTVRPPESVTEPEKLANMRSYGVSGRASGYEYDHLVPLELGGAVNDPRNLWPEPDYPGDSGYYLNPKDHLERALNRLVCDGQMPLARAQLLIARDWTAAYREYG